MPEQLEQELSPPHTKLRIVVGVMLIMGMAGGWWAMHRQKANKQDDAIRALRGLGCQVYLDYEWKDGLPLPGAKPPEARWLRSILGDAVFRRALAVDARGVTDLDAALRNLKWLPYLQFLDLSGTGFSDADAGFLHRLSSLVSLNLSKNPLSDDGTAELVSLQHLVTLSLAGTQVTDRSIYTLAQLRQLRNLDLAETRLDRDAVRILRAQLPNCTITIGSVDAVN